MTDHDGALLDRDMGLLLAAASRAVISLYRPLLKPYHLTHPQYLVMLALHEHDPRRAGDLSDAVQLTPGTLSPLFKRLELLGYITRQRDLADERRLLIALTERGRGILPGSRKRPRGETSERPIDARKNSAEAASDATAP